MQSNHFPAVALFVETLGHLPPDELVYKSMQARYLHHELVQVLGIAEGACEAREAKQNRPPP